MTEVWEMLLLGWVVGFFSPRPGPRSKVVVKGFPVTGKCQRVLGPRIVNTEFYFSLFSVVIPMIHSARTENLLHTCFELEAPGA